MRIVRSITLMFLLVFLLPLATHAAFWMSQNMPANWAAADWSSADALPRASKVSGAVVHVMAARTGRWKGAIAHHQWLVIKARGQDRYTRYDVVGWGRPVRRNAFSPDGRWYSNAPMKIVTLRGRKAEHAIPRIKRAIETYPYSKRGDYRVWPGPNSNTFVAHVARKVPELASGLLPTAVGKEFQEHILHLGQSPSGTGWQISIGGLLGITVGQVEGLEINLMGLVAGVDIACPAIKLPGWGRVGFRPVSVHGCADAPWNS